MIFCPNCQNPVPEGALMCRECRTPINHSEIAVGNMLAARTTDYAVGGVNWGAVIVGAALALGIWNGGMQLLVLAFGLHAIWFSMIVKVSAVSVGAFYAGLKSYSAELTHGLLVAAIVAAVNGALAYAIYRTPLTFELVLIDFVFIDFGTALFGAFLGGKMQR
ncbi:MAG: zinc ribbon domain-containing protein [Verrucomicrobia bacterium]|nr:zinc ribbon domain-containing protein [Verrucomicrobiota bacterium]